MIFTIKAELVSGIYMPDTEVSRTIRISGSAALDELCGTILDSIGFDHDHLYLFSLGKEPYSRKKSEVYCRQPEPGEHTTKEKLYSLPLGVGSSFWLVYDFGDDWTFSLTVEKKINESGNIRPSILASIGTVEQYPDEDEWEFVENAEDSDSVSPAEDTESIPSEDRLEEIGGDDMDFSDEYFDADEYSEDGSNPVLGRIMLRIVERQIEDHKPAFVAQAYDELQEKGYIRKAAKIRLANALTSEVFEILKYDKEHDENRYRGFVQEVLSEPFDPDRIPDIETGREHRISEGLDEFCRLFMYDDAEGAADRFSALWPDIRDWIDNNYTRMENGKLLRFSLDAIDEAMDFKMNLYDAVLDSGMAYLDSGKYEEGVKIQKDILNTFSWENGADAEFRDNIGTMLNDSGRTGEADQWFEDWYAVSPDNPDCTNAYVLCLQERGENARAREVLEAHLPEHPLPDKKYINLYARAADLYKEQGEPQKSAFYQRLADKIIKSEGDFSPVRFTGAWKDDDIFEKYPFGQPLKKDKKIYPNDPCPCGSGKKYKKCCGKKAKG